MLCQPSKVFMILGGWGAKYPHRTEERKRRASVPPFPHLRRNAAANMGAPAQPYTPKTGRAPPGGRGSDAARERFNTHRTAGRGSTQRERTEAAAPIPKKVICKCPRERGARACHHAGQARTRATRQCGSAAG